MKRSIPVDHRVYKFLYPFQAENDPPSWEAHCKMHILPEIRRETGRFYGEHESIEAKYPGLDYRLPHHRRRLARFPQHARLFEAFDALNLSPTEIYYFCNWEGTLLVKDRYEAERHVKIIDTTGSEVPLWQDPPQRAETPRLSNFSRRSVGSLSRASTVRQSTPRPQVPQLRPRQAEHVCVSPESEDDNSSSTSDPAPTLEHTVPHTVYSNDDIPVRQRQRMVGELLQARMRLANDGQPYSQEWQDHFIRLAGSSGWSHSVQSSLMQGVITQGPMATTRGPAAGTSRTGAGAYQMVRP